MTKFSSEKFKNLTHNGIWPVSGEGYKNYCKWFKELKNLIELYEDKTRFTFNFNKDHVGYKAIIDYCKKEPEMAVQCVTYLMVNGSAKWTHLMLVYDLTGHKPLPEHAGKFYAQIAMWLLYYDSIEGDSND